MAFTENGLCLKFWASHEEVGLCAAPEADSGTHVSYMPILSQGVQDRANFFEAIVRIQGDITDRIEQVIGRGNCKWMLLILLVLLALWYVRRQRLASL